MTAPETAADIYAVHRCPGAPGPLSPHELRFDLFDLGAIIIPVLWMRKAVLQGTHPVISATLQGRRRHFRGQREFPESSSRGVNLARPQRVVLNVHGDPDPQKAGRDASLSPLPLPGPEAQAQS